MAFRNGHCLRLQGKGGGYGDADARFLLASQPVLSAAGVILGLFVYVSAIRAEEPGAADRQIQAQLAAGEFAPALATARQADDPAQRDAWLAQIALAQAQSGSPQTSLQTAAEIGDDQRRAGVWPALASNRWAGCPAARRPTSMRSSN